MPPDPEEGRLFLQCMTEDEERGCGGCWTCTWICGDSEDICLSSKSCWWNGAETLWNGTETEIWI